MASKRNLKKSFNYVMLDIVEEAFYQHMQDESTSEKSEAIIEESVNFRNAMVSKINTTATKKEFSTLIKEMESGVDTIASKLVK